MYNALVKSWVQCKPHLEESYATGQFLKYFKLLSCGCYLEPAAGAGLGGLERASLDWQQIVGRVDGGTNELGSSS